MRVSDPPKSAMAGAGGMSAAAGGMSAAAATGDDELGCNWYSSVVEEEEEEDGREEEDAYEKLFFGDLEPTGQLGYIESDLRQGSQAGGRLDPTLPSLQQPRSHQAVCAVASEAAPEEQIGQEEGLQMGIQTGLRDPSASMSVARIQSLLSKRKQSGMKVIKPPTGKPRKSSSLNLIIRRSPVLRRRLMSPRMGHSGAKHLRPPSTSGDGSPSAVQNRSVPPSLHRIVRSKAIKRRKLRSVVWKEFEPIYQGNLVVQAKCIHCLDVFAADRETGRTACHRHLQTCKERVRMNQLVENMSSNSLSPDALALKNWKFDQEVSREAMVQFIVLQEQPYSLVDHAPFRNFIATLNPWFVIVSRTTVAEDVVRSYENRRTTLREIIRGSDSRVCLTADLWTSKQNMGYLCITCHFIDNNWKLQKRIINFNLVASPHDGITMFNALQKSLKDWQLEHKVFSITLDNAKNNNKMVGHLRKNQLDRHLLMGNKDVLHMRCASHVLNLIVQDGFKVIESATTRIRDSVKYIRSSQARKQRFEEIIVQEGISCEKRPTLDIPTRWNSTYLMLKSAVQYRTAFEALNTQDLSYMDIPSADEWKMADILCDILKPFYDATNVVSGSLYPTAHLYFHELWTVKEKIEKEASNEDQSIAAMAAKMREKFKTYWDISLLQICVPVVLDPRFKFNFVAFRLDAGFGSKGPTYAAKVKSTMKDLFSAYLSQTPVTHNNSQPRSNGDIIDEDNPWADWEKHLTAQKRSTMKNELEVYLEDELFPRHKNFDILQWWMMHSSKYPVLSRLARDLFAAPASTVASESAFSTSGRVISDYRSRLTSKNVEALICLQDWLRAEGHTGFKIADDVSDDEDQI